MEAPTIIIDSREQIPYVFQGVETVRRALPAGDYSVLGHEDVIAVERKSLDDFVNTVIKDRLRFKNELLKLTEYPHACVVVEGSLSDILHGKYLSGAHPSSLFGAVIAIIIDFRVPVFFTHDRQTAVRFTLEYLLRAANLQMVKHNNKENNDASV